MGFYMSLNVSNFAAEKRNNKTTNNYGTNKSKW